MSLQVKRQKVKDQYNRPRDRDGNLVEVLQPGDGYSIDDLLRQAYSRGWQENFFPDPNSPNDYPYWDHYLMPDNGIEMLVSVFGEVACCYNSNSEHPIYKVLEQQVNRQHLPGDFEISEKDEQEARELGVPPEKLVLERVKQRQQYLYVYQNNSPHYRVTHGGLLLHSLVGLVHSPITLEVVEWDERAQRYRLKRKCDLDHVDCRKDNNSAYNVQWSLRKWNQRVFVDWSVEQKRAFYEDLTPLPKEDRDQVLRYDMSCI